MFGEFDSHGTVEALEQAGVPTLQARTYVRVLLDVRHVLDAQHANAMETCQRLAHAGMPTPQAHACAAVLAEATGALEARLMALECQQRLEQVGVPAAHARAYGKILANIIKKSTNVPVESSHEGG